MARGRPRKIDIPRQFDCLGSTIRVEIVEQSPHLGTDTLGAFVSEDNIIYLKKGYSEEVLVHTLLHELMHCFANASGREDLFEDEGFCDAFGGLLQQYLKTYRK